MKSGQRPQEAAAVSQIAISSMLGSTAEADLCSFRNVKKGNARRITMKKGEP
ncbi:MAG: hypothetical protein IKD07_03120 [Clostridia bacterium]|nr:hypothetical protein [Clostridia bacterium]